MEKEDDKSFKRDICGFDFRSIFLVLISILLNIGKEDDKSFKRDIIVLISFLILFVTISFLVNIGKEMSLPGFRTPFTSCSCDKNHTPIIPSFFYFIKPFECDEQLKDLM